MKITAVETQEVIVTKGYHLELSQREFTVIAGALGKTPMEEVDNFLEGHNLGNGISVGFDGDDTLFNLYLDVAKHLGI